VTTRLSLLLLLVSLVAVAVVVVMATTMTMSFLLCFHVFIVVFPNKLWYVCVGVLLVFIVVLLCGDGDDEVVVSVVGLDPYHGSLLCLHSSLSSWPSPQVVRHHSQELDCRCSIFSVVVFLCKISRTVVCCFVFVGRLDATFLTSTRRWLCEAMLWLLGCFVLLRQCCYYCCSGFVV